MRHFIWRLFVVTAIALSFGAVPAVNADEDGDWPVASGVVFKVYPDISTIVIQLDNDEGFVTIAGFPFGFLERELAEELDLDEEDFFIGVEDCVAVAYVPVFSKNLAMALTFYCNDCELGDDCYEDDEGILLRDDELVPVPRSKENDEAGGDQNRDGKNKKDKKDKKDK